MIPFKTLLSSFRSLRPLTNPGRPSRRRQSLTIPVAAMVERLEIRQMLAADTMSPTFLNPLLGGNSPASSFQVKQGQTLYFSGTANDNVALSVITVNVSSPKVTNYTVSTGAVTGTSKSLSGYSINTGNTTYANVPGSYTVTIFAKDAANNPVASRTWNFTVVAPDTMSPTFSNPLLGGNSPASSFQVNQGQTLYFSGTANDNVALSVITVNVSSPKVTNYTVSTGAVTGTSKSLSGYSINTGNTTYANVPGSYTVTIFAKDAANNPVASKTWNFTVVAPDTISPTFSNPLLNGYSPGSSFQVNQGQTLNFSGTANDNVALSVITVNVSSPKVTNYTVTTGSVSGTSTSLSGYSINTGNTTYANVPGSYTVTIFAKDAANNPVASKTWNFTVVAPDTMSPTFSNPLLNGNSPGSSFQVNQGQTLNFSGTANDNVALSVITVKVSNSKVTDYTVTTGSVSGTSKSLSGYSINTGDTNYANVPGSYTVTIFAKDAANNPVASKTWNFTVVAPDTMSPTFSNPLLNGNSPGSSFQVNQGQTLNFSGTANDNVALSVITVKVSNSKVTDYTVTTESVSGTSKSLSGYSINTGDTNYANVPGSYTVTIFAKDAANNPVASQTWNFTVVAPSSSGPRVISNTPSGNMAGPVSFVDITFDKNINGSTFTIADVVVFQSSTSSLLVAGVAQQAGGNTYRVSFNSQSTAGTYTMVIGPNIADTIGNMMNQDGDTTNGEVTQDSYTATFTIQASSSLSAIQNAWNQVASGFVPSFLGIAGMAFSAVNSVMTSTISSAASAVSGILPNTAEISFGVELNGEVTAGLPGFSATLAGIATGYSFTYDIPENNWTISRDFSVNLLGAAVVFEQYITFASITAVPDQITVGLSAAGQLTDGVALEIGQLFTASFEAGSTQKLTFSAEATLSTSDFVNNYVQQGNGDATITAPEFAQSLADVFIPYYGDTWWQNILKSTEFVIPVNTLIDIYRTDTVVGILAHAPAVSLAVTAGTELSAGAALGLGGQVPVIVPVIQAAASVSAGVSIAAGIESVPLWSTTLTNWHPVNPTADIVVLQNNIPTANLSGAQDSQQLFKISVPAGQTKLEIKISGGTGDADLYVKKGTAPTMSSYDYFIDQGGNDETISVDNPAAGDWYVMLRGWNAFAGVTLVANYSAVTTLQNNVPISNLAGAQDSQQFFKITVPAGQTKLEIKIFGGSGDADLYVKKGNVPTTSAYDYFLDQGGNNETITVNSPSAGEWYVMLRGYNAFAGVTLQVTFS